MAVKGKSGIPTMAEAKAAQERAREARIVAEKMAKEAEEAAKLVAEEAERVRLEAEKAKAEAEKAKIEAEEKLKEEEKKVNALVFGPGREGAIPVEGQGPFDINDLFKKTFNIEGRTQADLAELERVIILLETALTAVKKIAGK